MTMSFWSAWQVLKFVGTVWLAAVLFAGFIDYLKYRRRNRD